jgi:hypothetical protein
MPRLLMEATRPLPVPGCVPLLVDFGAASELSLFVTLIASRRWSGRSGASSRTPATREPGASSRRVHLAAHGGVQLLPVGHERGLFCARYGSVAAIIANGRAGRQPAPRASVGGGFLASLVTPAGRLRRPNWAGQFVAPWLNHRHADFQSAAHYCGQYRGKMALLRVHGPTGAANIDVPS